MKFWDSSAVVPLLVQQAASPRVTEWLDEESSGMAVWTLTPVEVVSAIRRLARERSLDEDGARVAEVRLIDLMSLCHVVVDVEPVKALATRLLRVHPLRAFDACQLGAALLWTEGLPQGQTLCTLDRRLATAAELEGFVVPD